MLQDAVNRVATDRQALYASNKLTARFGREDCAGGTMSMVGAAREDSKEMLRTRDEFISRTPARVHCWL